ncbi:MAG TPA: hypothetical protein VEB66_12095 [Opitutaceae bacterium]|nr:hypothetical protein [Opitutaceae bacterium]
MKTLLEPEILLAILAFVATAAGVRGDFWRGQCVGLRKLSGLGWLTLVVALLVAGIQIAVAVRHQREEARRAELRRSLRELALEELDRTAEQLRQHFVRVPRAIHESAGPVGSSSLAVLELGESLNTGKWGWVKSPFALSNWSRPVRLSAIGGGGENLPTTLGQFMTQWTARLDRALERGRDDLSEQEKLLVRQVLQHEFIRRLHESIAQTRSMEAFSTDARTALFKEPADKDRYVSFVSAVERLQALRESPPPAALPAAP